MLKWGILGTGAIANAFARGLRMSATGQLVAVGSRTPETARHFAGQHKAPVACGGYEELLAAPAVEAVYVSTPHPFHAEWTVRAAEAGKHVLCEKPMAMNRPEAERMIEAARTHGVFLMEAFMYRCHPQTRALADLVRAGTIGEVRMIRASFGFGGGDAIDPESRVFSNALGGGGILDVGCYAVSGARLVAGAAAGQPFADPHTVVGTGRVGETAVDEWAAAVLEFDNGVVAQVSTAVRVGLDNMLEIYGADGRITVPNPWVHGRRKAVPGRIAVTKRGRSRCVKQRTRRTAFSLEADVVARAIAAGRQEAEPPAMTWADTLGNMAVLDRWRAAVGVTYPADADRT